MFHLYFSKVVCLSLASRLDRRKAFDNQANTIGMKFEYFTATPKSMFQATSIRPLRGSGHNLGTYAHNIDVAAILEQCIDQGLESVLFFEDDCVFETIDFLQFENLFSFSLPPVWDVFHLGAWHRVPPQPYSGSLYKVVKAHLSHAVAIHKRAMPLLLEHCQKNKQLFDQILAEKIHALGHSYCLYPNVANQSDGYSDLWEMEVDQSTRTSKW